MERYVYGFLIGSLYCISYFLREELLFQPTDIKARVVNLAKWGRVLAYKAQGPIFNPLLWKGKKMVMRLRI